jgi:plastocyanin
MDHDEWLELVSAMADGELGAPEAERLADHLAGCRSCSLLLDRFEADRRRARLRATTVDGTLVEAVLDARADDRLRHAQIRRALVRRGTAAAAAVAAAIVAVTVLPTGAPTSRPRPQDPDEAVIAAHDHSFDRVDIEVAAGTTVEWLNAGTTTHHLVRDLGGATIDQDLPPGRAEEATFEEAGTFRYFCTVHPEMHGTVTVDDA